MALMVKREPYFHRKIETGVARAFQRRQNRSAIVSASRLMRRMVRIPRKTIHGVWHIVFLQGTVLST